MTARVAYPMLYERVTFGRTVDERLEIDALLGDEGAAAEIARREQDLEDELVASGLVEIG